jgi:hypothetical protein
MSESIKKILGDELYAKVTEKMGDKKFDLLDGYVTKSRFNEVNDKSKFLDEKITSYESQINSTKNLLKDNEELKAQYSKIQNDHKETMKAKDKEISNIQKKTMFEKQLEKEGAKHTKLLMKDVNWDNINIENDNLVGAGDVIKGIKENYSDLFITKTTEGNVPKDTGTNTTQGGKFDFSKL